MPAGHAAAEGARSAGAALPTFGLMAVVGLFLRTWPYMAPMRRHIVLWVLLQLFYFTSTGLAVVFIEDVLNNKIMLGQPLEPAQATFFLLDETYAAGELAAEQRLTVRNRLLAYAAVGVLLNTALLQIVVLHYYFVWMTQQINQRLRVAMIKRAERLSLRYHSHARTGDAIYRIYQDSNAITSVVDTVILDPINIAARCLQALFILWLFNPWLGLLAIGVLAPMVLIVVRYTPRLQRFSQLAREASSDLTSRIQETFAAIRVVKANQAEAAAMARFDADSKRALDAALRLRMEMAALWMLVLAVAGAGILAGDYLMASWTVRGEATWLAGAIAFVGFGVWNLGAYQAASGRGAEFFDWSRGLINKWSHMQDMAMGLRRAYRLLEEEADVAEPADPEEMPSAVRSVRFSGVTFAYEAGAPVLDGVDLHAAAGTVTALVGTTGAGKSTLMSLLLRLYDPQQGSIAINGVDVRRFGVESLRASIAIALQQNVLFAATVADNIGYAARGVSRADVQSAAEVACADEFVRDLAGGYDAELGERGGKLSSGQRQRLSIARAIVRDTPILILDEPTASLDAETEQRLLRNLSAWGTGRVVFLITHRLSTIRNADRIAFLENGRIAENGDHDQLMAIPNGRYRAFVAAETGAAA